MGKKKSNNKNQSEANGDVDDIIADIDGNVEVPDKENVKKSKKNAKRVNWDEDVVSKELEKLTINENDNEYSEEPKGKKKKEKKSKKASKKESDSDEEMVIQPKLGGGFAALMDDEDDEDEDDVDEDEDVDMDEEPKPEPEKLKKQTKKKKVEEIHATLQQPVEEEKVKKGKKSKKKGRKGDDDDEDLDKILAELESEYKGEKPKEEIKSKESSIEKEDGGEKTDPIKEEIEDSAKLKKKKKKEAQKAKQQLEQAAVTVSEEPVKSRTAEPIKSKSEPAKPVDIKPETDKPADIKPETDKPVESSEKETSPDPEKDSIQADNEDDEEEDNSSKKKKKKKKKKGEKDDEDDKTKKAQPNKKRLAAMKEILAKQKEEEERLEREEHERLLLEEEQILQREEAKRLEEEKKERRRQKERERKERLKAEGKLLTNKQKLDQKRAQAMLDHLKAQGVDIPKVGEKPLRPGTRIRPKKNKQEANKDDQSKPVEMETSTPEDSPDREIEDVETSQQVQEESLEVKDNWDEESIGEDEEEDSQATKTSQETDSAQTGARNKEEEEDDSDDEESSEDDSEHKTEAEKRKVRAIHRIEKRKQTNKKNFDIDILRCPVVCVLGHVDHGKTKILDKLRRTNVQEGEVGGITQQIGATNVPADAIKNQCKLIKDFKMESLKFPGLLIIDTPGHESFSNLRTRGSSLCDIAILVVDITQGLEPQTIESINLLKAKKTPFIVALNKVDRVFEWESHPNKDIREVIKLQNEPCKNDFERRTKEILLAFNSQGLNAALFWENPDPRSYLSLVPTSAISGDGMGNLIAMICNACQTRLAQRLIFNEELQCTVLEVKTIQGHGTTIDVILVNGRLREGDTIILAGTEGPIVTQIRSLLLPKPMKEIRVKGQYDEHREIKAAQGVKIAARELEKAIAGLNLQVAYHEDEVELLKDQVDKEFSNAMKAIKVKDKGVYVQASTLGALEALLEFFKTNKVPYCGIRVGPVVKRDVMKATAMLEHDPMYAVILAFDVKVERDAQELADKEGVKIFSEETIYHLGDRYVDYLKKYKKKQQDEFKHIAVFPSRLKILPAAIFNKRDPIVLGVTVDAGVLREGTPLCVPSKEFVEIGIVTSLEFDHKSVELARKGVDVCIKIEPMPGNTPKLFGRHFEATDVLVSKISRESIDACKDYFREDLSKTDWKLMADLKKEFGIL